MAKKCILILLDGLGDRSYNQLNHQTPLQAANTPVLDRLSASGSNGIYHPARIGLALPSENAHFIMFGYDMTEFPGRGAFEALGAGIGLKNNEVAVLSHFTTLCESDGRLLLKNGKPDASDKEMEELARAVCNFKTRGVNIRFVYTGGSRGIITLDGQVSPYITDSDPFVKGRPLVDILPWADFESEPASITAARGLKDYLVWVYNNLENHTLNLLRKKQGKLPVNGLVTQRAGKLKNVTSFADRYGLRGLSISSGMVYWGLSTYIGMDFIKVTDSKNPGKDISERLEIAFDALSDYDFIHVHTKAPDEAAHKKNPLAKKSVIESLDTGIGKSIRRLIDDPDILLVITADHSTPSSGPLIHSGESVPLMFCGNGVRRDKVKRFDEIEAVSGALGSMRGKELLYMILNHMDRAKLQGIMDTPVDQPYWPGNYEPFLLK